MYTKFIINILSVLMLINCSGVSFISSSKRTDLYRKDFLKKVENIKKVYSGQDYRLALKKLSAISDKQLLPAEQAYKYNLMGVVLFTEREYEKAISYFDKALITSRLDNSLTTQIHLNSSSCYFKLELFEKSLHILNSTNPEYLSPKEERKYYYLKFRLSQNVGDNEQALLSLINYLGHFKSITKFKTNVHFQTLLSLFFKMGPNERLKTIEQFSSQQNVTIAYLGYLEAEKLYYDGNKEDANKLLEWIKNDYENFPEIMVLIEGFASRITNNTKINPTLIGVILPLTGRKSKFGKRALRGIDTALSKIYPKGKYKIIVKNSKGHGPRGAFYAKELIQKNHVSAIIGGLFSSEAKKEYLECKKHGVFFISLSQVFLADDRKNHLLLEMPGSIESQVERLFSEDILTNLGKKTAIIYPNTTRGKAYLNEFWKQAQEKNIEVTSAVSFKNDSADLRDPVKNILGLKFPRERFEEHELLSEIHSLEKRQSIKRIQTLKPQIDFDWIFIPSYPQKALQLIPAFSYYDAFKLNIVGGPSWGNSKKLSEESYKLGKLYYIGNPTKYSDEKFTASFIKKFRRKPKLIEVLSFDSLSILLTLMVENKFTTRDEFDSIIRSQNALLGSTGTWTLTNDMWIKSMVPMQLKRGKIQKMFVEQIQQIEK